MNAAWALQLSKQDAASLAVLRLMPGIHVGETNTHVWVRGQAADEALALMLRALPVVANYDWLTNDRLRKTGSLIACDSLPSMDWRPIAEWAEIHSAPAALAGLNPSKVALRLVPSSRELPANVLLTDFSPWQEFALKAGAIRLRPLRFAASADEKVVIWGQPLPPLRGRRFVEQENIAVPAGFTWQPAVNVEIVRRLFAVSGDMMVLWDAPDSFIRLHGEQFVPATREGVRATSDALRSER